MTALSGLAGAEDFSDTMARILGARLLELAEAYKNVEKMKLTFRKSEILEE